MKIKTTRTTFAGAVSRVSKAISGACAGERPALGCVLVKGHANGEGVTLVGSNIDITLSCEMPCEVTEPCEAAIPATLLDRLLAALPEGVLDIEYDRRTLSVEIRSDVGRTKFSCVDPSLYPAVGEEGDCASCTIPNAALREILRKVIYSASTTDERKVLKNTLFAFKDGMLNAVAANGRTLARVDYNLDGGFGEDMEILIPPATCALLANKEIIGSEGVVKIEVPNDKRNCAVFSCGGVSLRTKLYDDVFPNYRKAIPPESETPANVDRKRLIDAIERASIFSPSGESGYVALQFKGDGSLRVSSQKSEAGATDETIPMEYGGGDVRILLAKRYVAPILKAIDDDEVTMHISSPTSPVMIKCSVPFFAVVMPVRDEGSEGGAA